jgi:hypothetical protein
MIKPVGINILPEILTEYFWNARLERYRHNRLLEMRYEERSCTLEMTSESGERFE